MSLFKKFLNYTMRDNSSFILNGIKQIIYRKNKKETKMKKKNFYNAKGLTAYVYVI